MAKDPFGFDAAASDDDMDLSAFAPKPKPVDRKAAQAVREVARDAGFTRRAASKAEPPPAPEPPPPGKSRKRRVNITELLGIQDRYPETERAQLNMLAPVPVVLRWRKLVQAHQLPAWEILERAMDALETQGTGRE
jgi:hypothetical protein